MAEAAPYPADENPANTLPPKLIDAVETQFDTDFAIIVASQDGVEFDGDISDFAVSDPGHLALSAGSKYSRVHLRAERWDAKPPMTDEWEDVDDLPFAEVITAGRLMLGGFDPGEVGLDLSGLGTSRVQVFARGRHRYRYNSDINRDSFTPQEWMIRFYPVLGAPDPMVGGPRRIAGQGGIAPAVRNPWQAAVHGHRTSGWSHHLLGSHAYSLASTALAVIGTPMTRAALASQMVRGMPPWEPGGADSEETVVPPRASLRDKPDPLAVATGRATITTVGEAIDAVIELGLILVELRHGQPLLVPNPSPEPAWVRLGLADYELRMARWQALRADHIMSSGLIETATRWSGTAGLSTTPRRLAMRWAITIEEVVGALRLLGGGGAITASRELTFDSDFDADEDLLLHHGMPHHG